MIATTHNVQSSHSRHTANLVLREVSNNKLLNYQCPYLYSLFVPICINYQCPYLYVTTVNHPLAVRIAELPLRIRGYGPVKTRAIADYERERAALMEQFAAGEAAAAVAAE